MRAVTVLLQVRRSLWHSVVDAAMMQKAKEESALLTVSKYTKALKVRTLWRTMVVCVVEAERARSRQTQQLRKKHEGWDLLWERDYGNVVGANGLIFQSEYRI